MDARHHEKSVNQILNIVQENFNHKLIFNPAEKGFIN